MAKNVILHIDYTETSEEDFFTSLKNILNLRSESLFNWLQTKQSQEQS